MAIEIERKYLVSNDKFKSLSHKATRITQGYLNSDKARTVRVRVMGEQGFLTIKGLSNQAGLSRFEWEKEISVSEAQELLKLCEPGVIDKTRYLVEYQHQVFEVDEFYGDNQGLIVAELEIATEQQTVSKPDWLGDEVTGDNRYYNSTLMKTPYTQWV
ncbi:MULTISPECIES: CYTH domain-containing protein [Shewanella]|jgi:adenylate cyclase|uniref:CYTH domain-containing protein n=1 Tax=Shewanella holmiensis TaxID=2952222 RepID=A0A9X3ANG4_9GAMM|nr:MULTISPECIES: CYTH domain-containing protein [Shewanella]MCT7941927.1 CYTH domain-containing protein [Shewanella holmiensis]MDP5146337.1 CYTH domain-containing protein [Shewanella sp. ULN5]